MTIFKRGPTRALVAGAMALAAMLWCTAGASAATVTYSTTGSFAAGSSSGTAVGNTLTSGGFTITFTGQVPNTIDPDTFGSTNADLGIFTVTGAGSMADFGGAEFSLTIFQTAPGTDSASSSATLQGQLAINASNAVVLSFNPDPVVITAGGFATFYDIADSTPINPPNQNGGLSDLRSVVSQVIVPTPGAATAGFALMGLVGLRRRRAA